MLSRLRNVQVDRLDVEDCVELLAYGKLVVAEFQAGEIPIPEWVMENLAVLKNEVKARRRDSLERALKLMKAKQNQLKTAEEKRAETASEIARLEKLLAG